MYPGGLEREQWHEMSNIFLIRSLSMAAEKVSY